MLHILVCRGPFTHGLQLLSLFVVKFSDFSLVADAHNVVRAHLRELVRNADERQTFASEVLSRLRAVRGKIDQDSELVC